MEGSGGRAEVGSGFGGKCFIIFCHLEENSLLRQGCIAFNGSELSKLVEPLTKRFVLRVI